MKYIGAHISITAGLSAVPNFAKKINATAFALFTKVPTRWSVKELTKEEITAFKNACSEHKYTAKQILPHASYMINLGQYEENKRKIMLDSFIFELNRCKSLGLNKLVVHPGSTLNVLSKDDCIKNIANSIRIALENSSNVMPILETMSGQGGEVGSTLEELAKIIEYTNTDNIGICIDTAHLYAAGYKIDEEEGYEDFWNKFDSLIGRDKLAGVHVNNSKNGFQSHIDRHENLEIGFINQMAFKLIMKDKKINKIPLILETPNVELWEKEIEFLKQLEKN